MDSNNFMVTMLLAVLNIGCLTDNVENFLCNIDYVRFLVGRVLLQRNAAVCVLEQAEQS